jgi:hypothetical protein
MASAAGPESAASSSPGDPSARPSSRTLAPRPGPQLFGPFHFETGRPSRGQSTRRNVTSLLASRTAISQGKARR